MILGVYIKVMEFAVVTLVYDADAGLYQKKKTVVKKFVGFDNGPKL